jgi:hypothetical protein
MPFWLAWNVSGVVNIKEESGDPDDVKDWSNASSRLNDFPDASPAMLEGASRGFQQTNVKVDSESSPVHYVTPTLRAEPLRRANW